MQKWFLSFTLGYLETRLRDMVHNELMFWKRTLCRQFRQGLQTSDTLFSVSCIQYSFHYLVSTVHICPRFRIRHDSWALTIWIGTPFPTPMLLQYLANYLLLLFVVLCMVLQKTFLSQFDWFVSPLIGFFLNRCNFIVLRLVVTPVPATN